MNWFDYLVVILGVAIFLIFVKLIEPAAAENAIKLQPCPNQSKQTLVSSYHRKDGMTCVYVEGYRLAGKKLVRIER